MMVIEVTNYVTDLKIKNKRLAHGINAFGMGNIFS